MIRYWRRWRAKREAKRQAQRLAEAALWWGVMKGVEAFLLGASKTEASRTARNAQSAARVEYEQMAALERAWRLPSRAEGEAP